MLLKGKCVQTDTYIKLVSIEITQIHCVCVWGYQRVIDS